MKKWDIPDDVQARVMQYLTQEKFIDDERYCRFFIKDKIKYNKWGRRKVEQALYMKRIPSSIYGPVLDEIPAEDYVEVLRPLIKSKRKTVKAATEYERNMKLIKFALGRGFSMDIIKDCIGDATDIDDD